VYYLYSYHSFFFIWSNFMHFNFWFYFNWQYLKLLINHYYYVVINMHSIICSIPHLKLRGFSIISILQSLQLNCLYWNSSVFYYSVFYRFYFICCVYSIGEFYKGSLSANPAEIVLMMKMTENVTNGIYLPIWLKTGIFYQLSLCTVKYLMHIKQFIILSFQVLKLQSYRHPGP